MKYMILQYHLFGFVDKNPTDARINGKLKKKVVDHRMNGLRVSKLSNFSLCFVSHHQTRMLLPKRAHLKVSLFDLVSAS